MAIRLACSYTVSYFKMAIRLACSYSCSIAHCNFSLLVILYVQRTCLLMLKNLEYISLKHFFDNQASNIYVD
jgi:hypothetical protein